MNDESKAPPASSSLGGPERLKQIAEQITSGQQPEPVTVRELLLWFGAYRRGSYIVDQIRSSLSAAKLATNPDFEGTYIDSPIEFVLAGEAHTPEPDKAAPDVNVPALTIGKITADPTYRIGKLRSANTSPISVKRQQNITEAITIMLANDFSQLPVMEGEREVKGIISWTSIGSRLALGVKCTEVRECVDSPHEISATRRFLTRSTILSPTNTC